MENPKVVPVLKPDHGSKGLLNVYVNNRLPCQGYSMVCSSGNAVINDVPSHQLSRKHDVLRRQAGSYIAAAERLLNKVNRPELTLLN
mmetsp:Transcript_5724/g.8783  ORF Transcript_5724/g.8783 Transcript_5724/m.8783 type:complete len:87 (-) Transcript_5724:1-261(-)